MNELLLKPIIDFAHFGVKSINEASRGNVDNKYNRNAT